MSPGAEPALSPAGDAGAHETRCYRCGDVIGVYEPMIALIAGGPMRSSRTALGIERTLRTVCFHVDCFPDGKAVT
jgi:hypothetical protein